MGTFSRACIAIDDAPLRRRVHNALPGIAHKVVDVASLGPHGAMRRVDDENLLIVIGPTVGGAKVPPIDVAQQRMFEPLVPIILCTLGRDPLLHRLSELAIAGVDRVVVLDGPDPDQDLRTSTNEAIKHVLPSDLNLGMSPLLQDRGSAVVCARNGYLPMTETSIARAFDCDRSLIWKAVKRTGWPDVRTLIGQSRLLWAAI